MALEKVEAPMRRPELCSKLAMFLFFALAASHLWAQGPPYQTDDPVPVDLHHYEFYIFGSMDGTPAETDSTGPAIEFNWGAIPRVQLHAILPWGSINPSNNPVYLPGGTGQRLWSHRYGTGRKDRLHQRIEVHPSDRHFYDA
jgi:hypothetical protein